MNIGYSVCPHDCPSACALEVEVLGRDRIGRVRGAGANSYTAGVVCAKVARYADRLHHSDRLTHPLLRTGPKGSGQFTRIGWDEALDRTADAFRTATEAHGPASVWPYYYAGTMGIVQRDGINRLRHEMGYSGQLGTICSSICEAGWMAGVGRITGPDPREMALSDLIIVWGGNPVATQVNAMVHISRARKERGARLVVIDPYRTGTAAVSDIHLAPRPGTDGALACAIMHTAFRDGFADRAYISKYTDNPANLEAHFESRTPEWAQAITGIPAADIEAVAALYNRTDRAYIRCGYGFTRSRNGAAALHAVTCLPTVTGKWRHPGGGAFWNNRALYNWNKSLVEGWDVRDTTTRMLDMSRIGSVLTNVPDALAGGGPVHAMLVQNTNPAAIAPDSNRVRAGLMRGDLFTCVHEHFMTDTALLADIVLPATMFLEHDDVYQAGGHSHIQIGARLVDPPAECRSNHEVLQGLASRLGATHPGFSLTAMELVDATLRSSGWPSAETVLAQHWLDVQPDFETSHFLNGFGQPDKKFHFSPDWSRVGPDHAAMPKLPDQMATIDDASEKTPFRLVTAPARQFLNTTFTESEESRRREDRPTALLHPDDANRLGLKTGEKIRLGNVRGEVVVHLCVADGMQPGVVIVESVWPNTAFEGGIGINALTSDDPAPPLGGAVFHDTAIWLRAEAFEVALAAE